MSDRTKEMAQDNPGRLLLRYSAPAMVGMVSASLYNAADAVFVGRGAGNLALAGLTVAFPVQMLIMAIAQTVGLGSASLISRSLGKGELEKARRVAGSSFVIVTLLGVAFTALGFLFIDPLLRLFGATDLVMEPARDYLSIVLLGSPFFCFAVSANNVARSEGSVRVAMTGMVAGTLLNFVFDPIFIFGLDMGIRGAAIATVLGNIGSFSILVAYFVSGKGVLQVRRRHVRLDLETLGPVMAVGSSSFGRNVAVSVYAIVVNNAVTHHGSELDLALLGVTGRVLMLVLMPMFGVVQGMQPIVGFNYGARQWGRVRQVLFAAIKWASIWSFSCWLLLILFPGPLLSLFDPKGDLHEIGSHVVRILLLLLPLVGFQVVASSFFQHIGKAIPALVLSMSRQILFLIPLILLLPLFWGLDGVWFAFPTADLLSALFTAAWLAPELRRIRLAEREGA